MQKILIMKDGRLATEQRLKHFNQSLTYFFFLGHAVNRLLNDAFLLANPTNQIRLFG